MPLGSYHAPLEMSLGSYHAPLEMSLKKADHWIKDQKCPEFSSVDFKTSEIPWNLINVWFLFHWLFIPFCDE
jgi:hypothetical protein